MHVAITGASSGIGAALARELGRAGHSMTLVARSRAKLGDLADALGPRTHIAAHDLSVPETAADWMDAAEAALGPIDVLVNNAGAHLAGATASIAPERGEALVRLDLLTPMRLTQRVLPAMLARRSGTIVDITALAALTPLPGMAHYDAAKAGLAAWSEALHVELRGSGVHVVTVYPGYIADTELARDGALAYEPSRAERMMPKGTSAELGARIRRAIERKEGRVLYPYPSALALWLSGPMRWAMGAFAPSLRRQ